eukprot:5429918-Lingulodinium_polyedra.AAC.1
MANAIPPALSFKELEKKQICHRENHFMRNGENLWKWHYRVNSMRSSPGINPITSVEPPVQ